MRVFIQKKPRGVDKEWKTCQCVRRGNRIDIARRVADKLRKLNTSYVFRLQHAHTLFPQKRNNPFTTTEQRNALVAFCKTKGRTPPNIPLCVVTHSNNDSIEQERGAK